MSKSWTIKPILTTAVNADKDKCNLLVLSLEKVEKIT